MNSACKGQYILITLFVTACTFQSAPNSGSYMLTIGSRHLRPRKAVFFKGDCNFKGAPAPREFYLIIPALFGSACIALFRYTGQTSLFQLYLSGILVHI